MILYVSPFQERQAEALRQRLAERGAGRVTDDVTPEPAVDIQQLQQVSLYIDDQLSQQIPRISQLVAMSRPACLTRSSPRCQSVSCHVTPRLSH